MLPPLGFAIASATVATGRKLVASRTLGNNWNAESYFPVTAKKSEWDGVNYQRQKWLFGCGKTVVPYKIGGARYSGKYII